MRGFNHVLTAILILLIIFFLFQGDNVYLFPRSDDSVLEQAMIVAMEAKGSGQFTDTNSFKLECKQCGSIITGEDQALAHAKETGHSKFEERRNNV